MPKIIKNITAILQEKRKLGKPLSKHVKTLMQLKKNEGFTTTHAKEQGLRQAIKRENIPGKFTFSRAANNQLIVARTA